MNSSWHVFWEFCTTSAPDFCLFQAATLSLTSGTRNIRVKNFQKCMRIARLSRDCLPRCGGVSSVLARPEITLVHLVWVLFSNLSFLDVLTRLSPVRPT